MLEAKFPTITFKHLKTCPKPLTLSTLITPYSLKLFHSDAQKGKKYSMLCHVPAVFLCVVTGLNLFIIFMKICIKLSITFLYRACFYT